MQHNPETIYTVLDKMTEAGEKVGELRSIAAVLDLVRDTYPPSNMSAEYVEGFKASQCVLQAFLEAKLATFTFTQPSTPSTVEKRLIPLELSVSEESDAETSQETPAQQETILVYDEEKIMGKGNKNSGQKQTAAKAPAKAPAKPVTKGKKKK